MPFQAILATLIESHAPAARAAIFCDEEGERVEWFGLPDVTDFDVALLGAAYAPIAPRLPAHSCLRIVHEDRAVWLATVDNGYYLLVLCDVTRDGSVRLDLPHAVAALAAHM